MQIGYLGPLEVRDGERVVDVPGQRVRVLLSRLAVDVGRPVSIGALTAAVWSGAEPADPVNALQSLISRLRRTLGSPALVAQVPGGYVLRLAATEVDAERFTALVARGHDELVTGSPDAAEHTLSEALGCWRGEPLHDDDSADAHAVRARLTQLRRRAEVDQMTASLELGRAAEVLAGVEAVLRTHPLREDLVLLQLRALVDLGRPGEALVAYDATRRLLADTLGTDPAPRLQAVHAELIGTRAGTTAPRTNLRTPLTSFVGRDDTVAQVDELVAAGRLVTVVGAGGSGKTRLASEVAGGWVTRVEGGVWFVELAPVRGPEGVALAVLDGLGVREVALLDHRADRPRTTARERVLELLESAACVLVLDNCEHVVDAAAAFVAEVLGRCPGVRVLATSREPLGVDGEVLHPLAPLPVPDGGAAAGGAEVLDSPAVQLLLDRAAAAGAVLELDPPTVAAVAEVVRRLDGLPLAIELAAARLRVLPVAEVAARLSDRFRLLTGGRRTAVPRHRTLRAVVEWSWDLLTPGERAVAEQFCVFGAGATVAAVVDVCGVSDEGVVEDLLTALVDKSLLVVERRAGSTRFRMLETLREYGLERLGEHGTVGVVRRAHAEHFAAVARVQDARLRTSHQLESLVTVDTERENLLAALAFLAVEGDAEGALGLAVHLAWFWLLRENGEDAERWLRVALDVPGSPGSAFRVLAEVLSAVLELAAPTAQQPEEQRRRRLLAAADQLVAPLALPAGDAVGQVALLLRPVLLFFAEEPTAGVVALDHLVEHPDRWVRAAARTTRMAFAENEGDLASLRRDVDVVLSEWLALGDHWGLAGVRTARAQLRSLDGDLAGAEEDLVDAREDLRLLGGAWDDLLVNVRLADLRLRGGDVAGAREIASRTISDPRTRTAGSPAAVLADLLGVALALAAEEALGVRAGRPGVALVAARDRLLLDLAAAGEPTSYRAHEAAVAHAALVELAVRAGDLDGARAGTRTAYRLAVSTHDLPILAAVGVSIAALAAALGRPAVAAGALGLSARLRGSPDLTARTVGRLTRELTAAGVDVAGAHVAAAGLDREVAIHALDPDVLLT